MTRGTIYESIKHLPGRTEQELLTIMKNLPPQEKLETGARQGMAWLVKDAIAAGADVHANDDGALRLASYHGHAEVVKVLLGTGADVHAGDDYALQWASYKGHAEVVKVLLDAGADVHARDDWALQWASNDGHVEVVKALLGAGADVHVENDEALRWASENGHAEVVKLLLDAGADAHAYDDQALQWASENGHAEVVKLLKQHGAKRRTVNESIKHLPGRSEEEIMNNLKNLPFDEKYTEALREDLVDLYKMAFEEDPHKLHSPIFDDMMSYYITRTGIYGSHKILRFLLDYSDCQRISYFNKIDDAVDYALKYYNQAKDYSFLDEITRYREFFRVLLSDKRIASELDDARMVLCKKAIDEEVNEAIKHLPGRTPEEIEEIDKNLTTDEKLNLSVRNDNVELYKKYIEDIEEKYKDNKISFDIYYMSTIAHAAIFGAMNITKYWLQHPFETSVKWIQHPHPYISALEASVRYKYKNLLRLLLKSQRILDVLTPEQIEHYTEEETRLTFNESKINKYKMKKLNEEDQVFSDAHAKELLNLQVNYNKSLQDLNNKLAKQKSDLAIKYMNLDKQAAAQQATAQKAKVPTQQQQQPKQTGTTDTTGRAVDAQGNPVKDSYPDILKVNVLNEKIKHLPGRKLSQKEKEEYKKQEWLEDVFTQLQIIFDWDFNEEQWELWQEEYKEEINDFFEEDKDPYEAAIAILDMDNPDWRDEIYGDDDDNIDESLSTYDTSGANQTELQSLKDYMDAEGIDYKEDESAIEFDDEQLDSEWQDLIADMGLEQTDISADVKELEDETPEDEESFEDEEDDVVDTLSTEDDDIDIVDIDKEGDENDVFYVKVTDDGEDFVAKIYRLFNEGDWRGKVVSGNSDTFESLNYDPDWSEKRIISFLEDNYDSVETIDEDDFDKYIEEPDEEIKETLGGNGNMMLKTEKDKNEDLTKLDMEEKEKDEIKESYHIPTLEEYKR